MNMLSIAVFGIIVYALFSLLLIIFLLKLKRVWLKSSLITLYFCLTIFAFIFYLGMTFVFYAGVSSEDLRRSSVTTKSNVKILMLLHKSNAKEIDPGLYKTVTHNLENEIDCLLPVANEYLTNPEALKWQFKDAWLGDMRTICFPRDLPTVVNYRKSNPPVWDHGSYELVMKTYDKPPRGFKQYLFIDEKVKD